MLKKYMVYMDDGKDVFKAAIPAKNEKEAREYVQGNGEVVAIKDVTEEYPIDITKVRDALLAAAFGEAEMNYITRTLENVGIAENMRGF